MALGENQIRKLLVFLKEYGFITVDEKRGVVRIEESARKFLTEDVIL